MKTQQTALSECPALKMTVLRQEWHNDIVAYANYHLRTNEPYTLDVGERFVTLLQAFDELTPMQFRNLLADGMVHVTTLHRI